MKGVKLASSLTLPLETVTQSLAILARKRAGKSYLARRLAEQLLAADQQVIILDPKGDWWGIRSSADGKGPGYPVVILGGEHGDLPLDKGAAETIAHLIVDEQASVLLDLSAMRKQEVSAFLGGVKGSEGLLELVYRLKAREQFRTPAMLIVDEADAIAPQKPYPGEERMLGAMSDIVRRGGQRGLGSLLISQRSSVVNKDVLTQTQVMIALRTIAKLDLDAIMGWVDVHGVPEQAKVLRDSLPSLPIGDAWVLSPGWPSESGVFERIHGERITTFDSGATPKPGEKRIRPRNLADIDLALLEKRMSDAIERKKLDDPAELRKTIAELRKQLATKQPVADPAAVEKAVAAAVLQVKRSLARELREYERSLDRFAAGAGAAATEALREYFEAKPKFGGLDGLPDPGPAPPVREPARERTAPAKSIDGAGVAGLISTPERRLLTALAQYPRGLTKQRLAVLAGYQLNGTFYNLLGALRSRGAVTAKGVDPLAITETGLELLGAFDPLPVGPELREYWLRKLSRPEAKVLGRIFEVFPDAIAKENLVVDTGYQLNGTFYNLLGALRSRGLVAPKGQPIRAAAELFED